MRLFVLYLLINAIIVYSCNQNTRDMKKSLTYLALGDSYTIGEKVNKDQRWPQQLVDSLNAQGYHVDDPKIIAVTGWTTDELDQGIRSEEITDKTYDMVSLLIGVNNQYRGRSSDNFKEEFTDLLNQAIAFADGDHTKVFVVSIPDWGVTPFADGRNRAKIAQEIDEYNQVVEEVSNGYNIPYIDITTVSKAAEEDASLNASDGLHPSGKLYTMWKDIIYPYAEKITKR